MDFCLSSSNVNPLYLNFLADTYISDLLRFSSHFKPFDFCEHNEARDTYLKNSKK